MAPIGTTTAIHIGMIDRSGERTGTVLHFPPLEDDGSDLADLVTPTTGNYDLVKGPLTVLTLCNMTRSLATLEIETDTGTIPSDPHAQRELKALFTYLDETTNQLYSFSVPGPANGIIQAGTDEIDLGNVLVAAFVLAFETQCVSPVGNPVTVMSCRLVGRSS